MATYPTQDTSLMQEEKLHPDLGSYIIFQGKELELSRKMTDPRVTAWNVQNESGESCVARKWGSAQKNKRLRVCQRDTRTGKVTRCPKEEQSEQKNKLYSIRL